MLTIGLTLLAGLGSWAIYSVTFKDVGGILASKPLRVIAKYSYCIYVVHPIVWIFLAQPFRLYFSGSIVGSLKTMGAMCVVTFAIAFASWRALESPFLRMKKYFPYPATKTPDPSGEYASRVQTRRTS